MRVLNNDCKLYRLLLIEKISKEVLQSEDLPLCKSICKRKENK